MLNKELLMGSSKQEQLKVEITPEFIDVEGGDYMFNGYNRAGTYHFGKAYPLPYWGTPSHTLKTFAFSFNASYMSFVAVDGVTVHVEGYSKTLVSPSMSNGDAYGLGDATSKPRYLTFYPPQTVIWIQKHSNRSRKRVLRRGSSLGGSRC